MTTLFFPSQDVLQRALEPLPLEEVVERSSLCFSYDANLKERALVPLRNPGTGNLLKTALHRTDLATVFYPETPRVPHHLAIALNRQEVKGMADVTQEENAVLFTLIHKIAEIYKTISIQGFVIAQFDRPQQGHLNRYAIEIIPHLPGFGEVKNIVDKVDCNRHILFRTANLSPISYRVAPADVLEQTRFWQTAFEKEYAPLSERDLKIDFPYTRKESHQEEAEKLLSRQLLEILQDRGGTVAEIPSLEISLPLQVPQTVKSITVQKCFFCDEAVMARQLVYEYENVEVFYNMRKGSKPGSCFLILPKRHVEKVYGLEPSEIQNIATVRKALAEVLKEAHLGSEVIVYTQDDPAVGQTVFHSHEQIVAVDPQTIALTWTMMSLYPNGNVSDEEMCKICADFGEKLKQKLDPSATKADLEAS